MSVIEKLMENAAVDVDLLTKNDSMGDVFTTPRSVEFLLIAPDAKKAELVRDFITDHSYGVATTDSSSGDHRIIVRIEMPITQHVLHSTSGFMQCIAELYDLDYDGWGSIIQTAEQISEDKGQPEKGK